ncbi:conjugal transfer protein [Haloactinopolyspora alba]|nr:conjugal transfer protein [Haloactinopolyspora alba]
MKINWGFGPPKDGSGGEDDARDASATDAAPSEQHAWTAGSNLTTKAVVGLLWAALVAGPTALGLQLLAPPALAPVVESNGPGERLGEAAAVSEFAESAVVAWLETPEQRADSLRRYFGDLATERPEFPWTAERPAVAEVVKDETGLWSVVVGVDTTQGRPPGSKAKVRSGRQYFQLPVLYVSGELVAQALPAPVPAPATVEPLADGYEMELQRDHPAFTWVAKFLEAMLVTGDQSELEAYSSPGTSFRPLGQVRYSAIEVQAIDVTGDEAPSARPDDGARLEIRADVLVYGAHEQAVGAQYALVLRARENRWEIAEMSPAPVLAEPVPVPTPTPTPTPTTTGGTATSEPTDPPSEPSRSPETGGDSTATRSP